MGRKVSAGIALQNGKSEGDDMAFVIRSRNEASLTIIDKENGFRAVVKFDGCVHLDHYNAVDWEDEDEQKILTDAEGHMFYVHICDVEQFIRALTEIRELQQKHFPES